MTNAIRLYRTYILSENVPMNTNRTVQEVFSFDFDCVYVFYLEDCYCSGEAFAQTYNLDITIPEVDPAASEQIQRIVFVDISGNFVYEFQCDIGDVVFETTGIVIYQETVIKRKSSAQEGTLTIDFQSSEFLIPKTDQL